MPTSPGFGSCAAFLVPGLFREGDELQSIVGVRFWRSFENLTVERDPGVAVQDATRPVVPLGTNVETRGVTGRIQEPVERQRTNVTGVT